jgi:hypothetical protein
MPGGAQGEINTLNSMLSIPRDRTTATLLPGPWACLRSYALFSIREQGIDLRRGVTVVTIPNLCPLDNYIFDHLSAALLPR